MSDSNLNSIARRIDEIVAGIKFTLPGDQGSLGRDLAHKVAEEIIDRTVADRKAADGSPLKPNEPKYAARKKKRYGVEQPLVRTGQLLSLTSVLGKVDVSDDEVTIAIQVNGKLRDTLTLAKGLPRDEVEAAALASEAVIRVLAGAVPKKVVVVPDRLVNLVA